MSTEREIIQDGLASPFWQWLSAQVVRDWGPSGLRYQEAVKAAAAHQSAVVELQKVLAAQEAVHQVMRAPADRLAQLHAAEQRAKQGPAVSRRGPGL